VIAMTRRTRLARYGTAAAVVLLTFFVKRPIERLVGPGPPLIFFVPAVTISAWQGGLGPGLLATLMSSVICAYSFFHPIGSLSISNPNDVARLIAFVTEGMLTSVLMEALHRSRLRSEESRREAERFRAAASRAEERLRAIVDNTDALISVKDRDDRYSMMNSKLMKILGVAPGHIAGLTDRDLYPADVAEVLRSNDRRVLEEGRAIEFEEVIPQGDGHRTYVSLKFPLLDPAGVPYAVGSVSADITPLKEAQRRAIQAERLAAVGQLVAGLAHESRNALQRSQACLEMLARRVADRPETLDLVDGIQQAQDDLHRLYEEVRDYAAPIVLDRRSCGIRDLLQEAWARLTPSRAGRDVRLRERGDPALACPGDAFRLIQVFRNILDNSIAAAHDPVEIDVEWSATEAAGRPAVGIVVRDNGPGLTPEQRCNLFEPFYTTKSQGTGLGMAITKRIVDAHEGLIEAGPDDDRGATILITLPRGTP
jgi:two-component system, LuxR family, sensor kinase FixL